jgi:capsular exopolysaccharide synthesis family protein
MSRNGFYTVTGMKQGSSFVEAYGLLVVNLILGHNGTPVHCFAVTAAREGDGATTTAVNIGLTLAQIGRTTLLVEANLRTPALEKVFKLKDGPGLVDVLTGAKPLKEAVRPTGTANLFVLTAGKPKGSPHALLDPRRIETLVQQLRQGYDFVVFDTAALLKYPDTLNLVRAVDGMLLVVPAHDASGRTQQEMRRRLERVEAKVLGAVLNRVPPAQVAAVMG